MNVIRKTGLAANSALVSAIVALVLIHFWSSLDGAHSASINQDNLFLLLPVHSYVSRHFDFFNLPLRIDPWNLAIYHNPEFGLEYPFYFFWTRVYDNPEAAIINTHFVVALHVAILAAGTALFLRALGISRGGALLGASIVFSSAHVRVFMPWLWALASYSWVPWALAGIVLVLERRRVFLATASSAIAIALLVTAHPAHAIVHLSYLVAALLIGKVVRDYVETHNVAIVAGHARAMVPVVVCSMLLSSVALFEPLLHQAEYIRFTKSGAVVGTMAVPFADTLVYPVKPADLLNVFVPLHITRNIGNSFLGFLPAYLAAYGAWAGRKRWYVIPFVILSIYALLLTTGTALGIAYINYYLPLMQYVRELSMHLWMFVIGASVLAAVGLDEMVERRLKGGPAFIGYDLAMVVLFVGIIIVAWPRIGNVDLPLYLALALASFAYLKAGLVFRLWPNLISGGLAILVVLAAGTHFYQRYENVLTNSQDPSLPRNWSYYQILSEIGSIPDIRDYRLAVSLKPGPKWGPQAINNSNYLGSAALYYDIPVFEYDFSPLPYDNVRFYFNKSDKGENLKYLGVFGGKYILTDENLPLAENGYVPVRSWGDIALYRTDRALPKQWLTDRLAGSYRSPDEFAKLVSASDDFLSGVYVLSSELDRFRPWLAGNGSPGTVERTDAVTNRRAYSVHAVTPALLVINEHFDSAWYATIDGKVTKAMRVNLDQVAIPVNPGEHIVTLTYAPEDFRWLVRIQVATLVGLLLALIAKPLLPSLVPIKRRPKGAVAPRRGEEH